MIQELVTALQGNFPLLVEEIAWDESILVIRGKDWKFYTRNPWRIINREKLICGCYDDEIADELNQLQSDVIVSITEQTIRLPVDIAFEFSRGVFLEIFSVSGYEPWVFNTPSGFVYVASPSDPGAFKI